MTTNNIVEFDSFIDLNDAHEWMETKMSAFRDLGPEWSVREAKITHLNGGWATGILFEKVKVQDID